MNTNLIHIKNGKATTLFSNIDRNEAKKHKLVLMVKEEYQSGVLCVVTDFKKEGK